jgi:hypothetical protein
MTFSKVIAVHEAGHLVIGSQIGMDEQGISFRPPTSTHGAGAWCRNLASDKEKAIIRSFSGLLAQIQLLPDSINADLRLAYNHSVIIDSSHPSFNILKVSDREFLSGAKDDVAMAWNFALKLTNNQESKALICLRNLEIQARKLVFDFAPDIARVVEDIKLWFQEPDRINDFMLLYPPQRAQAIIHKNEAA